MATDRCTLEEDTIKKLGKFESASQFIRKKLNQLIDFVQQLKKNVQEFFFLSPIESATCQYPSIKIEDLKVHFHKVGCKARMYVLACDDLANYVLGSAIVKKRLEELVAAELTSFLDNIDGYFSKCIDHHKTVVEAINEFKEEAMLSEKMWTEEVTKLQTTEIFSKVTSIATGIGSTVIGGGAGIAGVVTLAGILAVPPVCIGIAAAVALVGGVSAIALTAERKLTGRQGQINDTKKKVETLSKFYEALTPVIVSIDGMNTNVSYSDDHYAKPLRTKSSESILDDDVMNRIRGLQELMDETLALTKEYLSNTSKAFLPPT